MRSGRRRWSCRISEADAACEARICHDPCNCHDRDRARPAGRFLWLLFTRSCPKCGPRTGCIEYGPAIDLAVTIGNPPAIPRDDVVTVIEKWSSVEALLKHHVVPHMQRYGRTVKEIVKRVEIRVLEPA